MDNTPYCKICDSCGEELCCSPTNCKQHPDGDYCDIYLEQLKHGYRMYVYFMDNVYRNLPEELKQQIDKEDEQS
jgi:hypothetical protein